MKNCHGMWIRITWNYTVSNQKLKKLMVASINLVLISTSAISTENGGNLVQLMLSNIMGMICHKTLNFVYFTF